MSNNIAIILDSSGTVAALDGWTSFEWDRDYYKTGKFKLVISSAVPATNYLIKGNRILPPDEGVIFLIEQIERDVDLQNSGEDILTVTGRDLKGLFSERICLPPAGQAYHTLSSVSAESAIKTFVTNNAGSGAAAARQFPGLTVATNQNRGYTLTAQARYQILGDVITALSKSAGLGWEITYSGGAYVFDILQGVDNSPRVVFDTVLDTALAMNWLSSDLGRKTAIYVAGQGVGVARTIVTRYADGVEPTGYNRRELFLDSRNIADSGALAVMGDAKLADTKGEDSFEVTINPDGSFRYKEHWNLGDFVTLSSKQWGLSKMARIVNIKLKLDANSGATPDVSVTLDKPFPSIVDAIKQYAVQDSTADQ